jgi:hypothetical protein
MHENVLLAQEIMQSIRRKVRGSNVALKLAKPSLKLMTGCPGLAFSKL